MKWIFKLDDSYQRGNNKNETAITFEQKRNFTGEKGEDVLFLQNKNKEWEFIALYRISDVNIKNIENGFKQINVTLDFVKQFEEEKLLEDYVYSLKRVTNYAYPMRHFNRKYSRLYNAEFEAIVEDKIYLKRTILGTVLNAMHRDHQKAFIAFVAQESPELLTGKMNMDKALSLLLVYIDFAIRKPAQYLKESAILLKSIVSEEVYAEIGFSLEVERITSKNTQLIKQQENLIDEYLPDLFGFQSDNRGLRLLELEDNAKFKSLFKNSPLPISLN